jgi:mRNA interferase MazF
MDYQWTVFHADLDPTIGREQAGERPVLVISAEPLNQAYEVVMVVPITSRKNNRPARLGEVLLPLAAAGLRAESFALCYQVRTLDKRRLTRAYGTLDDSSLRSQIQETLLMCFDFDL